MKLTSRRSLFWLSWARALRVLATLSRLCCGAQAQLTVGQLAGVVLKGKLHQEDVAVKKLHHR